MTPKVILDTVIKPVVDWFIRCLTKSSVDHFSNFLYQKWFQLLEYENLLVHSSSVILRQIYLRFGHFKTSPFDFGNSVRLFVWFCDFTFVFLVNSFVMNELPYMDRKGECPFNQTESLSLCFEVFLHTLWMLFIFILWEIKYICDVPVEPRTWCCWWCHVLMMSRVVGVFEDHSAPRRVFILSLVLWSEISDFSVMLQINTAVTVALKIHQ